MKVKDLIDKLCNLDPNKQIIFYNLNDCDLESKELETILDFDSEHSDPAYCSGHIEFTIK